MRWYFHIFPYYPAINNQKRVNLSSFSPCFAQFGWEMWPYHYFSHLFLIEADYDALVEQFVCQTRSNQLNMLITY